MACTTVTWDAFMLTVGKDREGYSSLGRPQTFLSLLLSHPEKIFSESIPTCEKCQSVVKPGEPQGLGELELGPSPTLFPTLHLWSPLPCGSSPTVLQRVGICRLPQAPVCPDSCLSSSVSHVSSPVPVLLCLSLPQTSCFSVRIFRRASSPACSQ